MTDAEWLEANSNRPAMLVMALRDARPGESLEAAEKRLMAETYKRCVYRDNPFLALKGKTP